MLIYSLFIIIDFMCGKGRVALSVGRIITRLIGTPLLTGL